MIPAKPTKYGAIQYKSKLEARYACVLSVLGFTFKYEPTKHFDGKLTHIPDFFINELDSYAEVKPIALNQLEYLKAIKFAIKYRKPYILFVGAPTPQFYQTLILPNQLTGFAPDVSEEGLISYFSIDLINCLNLRRLEHSKKYNASFNDLIELDRWFGAIYQAEVTIR